MKHIHDDGGRAAAGFKGKTGDCVTRAWSIAQFGPGPSGDQYRAVYDRFAELLKEWVWEGRSSKLKEKYRSGSRPTSPRNGMPKEVSQRYAAEIGWVQTYVQPFKHEGKVVHMNARELPSGRLVVAQARHEAAVIDGVVYDIWDSSVSSTMGEEMRLVARIWQPGE